MTEHKATIEFLLFHSYLIALVYVEKVKKGGAEVRVRPIEVFKGTLSEDGILHVPTLGGKYAQDWFKPGEKCLVFTSHDWNTIGLLGRMPLVDFNGMEALESFSESKTVFEQFENLADDKRRLISWPVFRDWLIAKHPSNPLLAQNAGQKPKKISFVRSLLNLFIR